MKGDIVVPDSPAEGEVIAGIVMHDRPNLGLHVLWLSSTRGVFEAWEDKRDVVTQDLPDRGDVTGFLRVDHQRLILLVGELLENSYALNEGQ